MVFCVLIYCRTYALHSFDGLVFDCFAVLLDGHEVLCLEQFVTWLWPLACLEFVESFDTLRFVDVLNGCPLFLCAFLCLLAAFLPCFYWFMASDTWRSPFLSAGSSDV